MQDMRIARGDGGAVFVMVRDASSRDASTTAIVLADPQTQVSSWGPGARLPYEQPLKKAFCGSVAAYMKLMICALCTRCT